MRRRARPIVPEQRQGVTRRSPALQSRHLGAQAANEVRALPAVGQRRSRAGHRLGAAEVLVEVLEQMGILRAAGATACVDEPAVVAERVVVPCQVRVALLVEQEQAVVFADPASLRVTADWAGGDLSNRLFPFASGVIL